MSAAGLAGRIVRGACELLFAQLLVLATVQPAVARDEAAVPVAIPAIQGRGGASPWLGRRVQVQGVVTQRLTRGFALQDAAGDGDTATSDAIVVTGGRGRLPEVGDTVRLEATVREAVPGRAGEGAAARTELRRDGAVTVTGRAPLPAPVPLRLPQDAGRLASLEAMRVMLDAPLVVTGARVPGTRGRLLLAAGSERLRAPTDRLPPGPQAAARAEADRARLIVLDRPAAAADDDVRAGDRIGRVTGVLDAAGAGLPVRWRIVADVAPRIERREPRPLRPPEVPGTLRVAFANLHNWFTSLRDGAGCPPGGCRGARDLADWVQQRARLAAMLTALDADVLGLAEVEHDGDGRALQALVDAMNAATAAGRYTALPPQPALRESHDAVRVGLVYRPARVTPLGPPVQDDDPAHGRPPLAQRFVPREAQAGGPFVVVVAHLRSRRCDGEAADPDGADAGDGSGCFDTRRTRQAQALATFAHGLGGADGVLVLGDLNAHAQEAPLQRLRAAGFKDLLDDDADAYTYVHDGVAGRLDHALASPALAPRVRGAAVWHVNADEPASAPSGRRGAAARPAAAGASDHDPLIVGLGAPGASGVRRQGSQPTP